MNHKYVPRDYMDDAIEAVFNDFARGIRSTLMVMATGCHRAGQGILRHDGSVTKVEDLLPGDLLMGPDSQPRRVLALCRGRERMVRIQPIKGDSWVVNKSHILSLVETTRDPTSAFPSRNGGKITDVPVSEWMEWSKTKKHMNKLFRVGVTFPKQLERLRIHPYLLGLLLGDGSGLTVTTDDEEVVDFMLVEAGRRDMKLSEYSYAITGTHNYCRGGSPLVMEMKLYGVWGLTAENKFVPEVYKRSSRDDRRELLAGLIDTDGSLGDIYDFVSKSERLSRDVAFIARSLGLAAYVKPCEKCDQHGTWGIYWRVSISGHLDIVPCRIARKIASQRKQKKSVLRTGFDVEELGEEDYFGFTLDGDGRYLLDDFTVTHNTGKTEAYLQIAERYLNANLDKRVLIVAHREELITQPAKRWRRNLEEWPAIEMGDLRSEITEECDLFDSAPMNKRIVLASIQTLNSGKRCKECTADCQECSGKGKILIPCGCGEGCDDCTGTGKVKAKCKECSGDGWICTVDDCQLCFEHYLRRMQKFNPEDFGLIVFDEAHHCIADSYTRTIRYFRHTNKDVLVLGPTATPDRSDEEAMGQVFESVAYEYSLPQPIIDGWLTPIDQQFIVVDDLNLSNVRTTAGDLNSGDLEHEMLAEKVLHKVTTPLVEIACGIEPGTIDTLIKSNRLPQLADHVTKREPTLIHSVDVAHAERMTEIINRYIPDSALCIIGTTPKNIRRDGLKKFGDGGYQFLLSCGVFLEGTDLPNVSIIGMARPTKSRALYSQMMGRGLRPLSGLIDGIETPEERCHLILSSAKPRCLCIDFVGNSGRHKLISAADILGNELPNELVDGVIRKAARDGQPVDMLKALMQAKEEAEEKKRQQARLEALQREKQQSQANARAAERRAGIVAGVSWSGQSVNPFDVMDVAAKREPGWHKGRKPSESMKEVLRKANIPFTEETSFWESHLLIDEIFDRRKKGLCTFKQAKWLKEHGYDGDIKFDECRKIMDAWASNGWKKPSEEKLPSLPKKLSVPVQPIHPRESELPY